MKKTLFVTLLLIVTSFALFAIDDVLAEVDMLYDQEEYIESFDLLESTYSTSLSKQDQAEVLWRMARSYLEMTDDEERAGTEKGVLLDMFEQGEAYAEQAIELYPSADAYYWHSSNTGRWGETKGILDSLFKAKPMRIDLEKVIGYDDEYSDAYYVLGRLYHLLPGWPISFGEREFAVSYTRRAIDTYAEDDLKISYYKSLAEILWARDWDEKKRNKEIPKMEKGYNKGEGAVEKMQYYEYVLGLDYSPEYTNKKLKDMTDREEAQIIVDWLYREFDKIDNPSRGDEINIQEVRDLEAEW